MFVVDQVIGQMWCFLMVVVEVMVGVFQLVGIECQDVDMVVFFVGVVVVVDVFWCYQ